MDKKLLRNLYKKIRKSISVSEKELFDKNIFTHLINSEPFKLSELILIYVSVNDEADTYDLINFSIKNNKRVAVPICENNSMFFCEIHSIDDLVTGKYGIPTVKCGNNISVNITPETLCIVPALCFDKYGYRIGYGGGYYDRFLSQNKVKTVGVCYERCLCNSLKPDTYDIPVDYILTENCFRSSQNKEVSAYE